MHIQISASDNSCKSGQAIAPTPVKVEPEVIHLHRLNLRTFIENQDGLFVSLDFVKQDGTKRTLTGRLGVKSYLKGGRNNVERPERTYMTIFDLGVCEYRTVNLDTVSAMRALGNKYVIVD